MLVKIVIIVLLLLIIGSLISGLIFLVKDKGRSDRTVKALTWRIALSLVAFALLMASYYMGVIQPHGVSY
jgi:hypothetical protein